MPTRDDHRAAIILLLLAAAGLVVRFSQNTTAAPGAVAFHALGERPTLDSVAARAARLARPLGKAERIDLDVAPAEELARLPRVGPGLASRIVADRDAHGPFGSLRGLDRVPGVGPTLLQAVASHATFSGRPEGRPAPDAALRGGTAGSPLIVHPGQGNPVAAAVPAARASDRPRVSLNTADEAELVQLPGIGPVLARAIVADRAAHGPYRTLDDLARVRGIGAVLLARLKDRILVP